MKKHQIAIAVGALFLGTQAGIAALQQEEIVAPAVAADQRTAVEPGQRVARNDHREAAKRNSAGPDATNTAPSASVRQGFLARLSAWAAGPMRVDVFPGGQDEPGMEILPAQLAYLEEIERQRAASGQLIATGDAFPESDEPHQRLLPATIAYLDEVEHRRAASYPQTSQRDPQPESPEISSPSLWSSFVAFLKSLFGAGGSA